MVLLLLVEFIDLSVHDVIHSWVLLLYPFLSVTSFWWKDGLSLMMHYHIAGTHLKSAIFGLLSRSLRVKVMCPILSSGGETKLFGVIKSLTSGFILRCWIIFIDNLRRDSRSRNWTSLGVWYVKEVTSVWISPHVNNSVMFSVDFVGFPAIQISFSSGESASWSIHQ